MSQYMPSRATIRETPQMAFGSADQPGRPDTRSLMTPARARTLSLPLR
jgi:hypothetical protein